MSDASLGTHATPPPPPTMSEPGGPKRRRGWIVVVVAIVLALVVGTALVLTHGAPAEAQPLALAFERGQSVSYAIHMKTDGTVTADMLGGEMPMSMEMSEVVRWQVASVDEQGLATIEMTVSNPTGSVNGVTLPTSGAEMPPIEIVVASDGRIVSAGGLALGGAGQTQGFGFPGMDQITPLLPDGDRAVAPGDSWTKDYSQDFPFGTGTITFTASSTYDRNATVDDLDAAVIETHLTVPLDFTLNFRELADAIGRRTGTTDVPGIDALADASIAYSGSGHVTQTSFVDLDAKQLLQSQSKGDFDISMDLSGVPQVQGPIAFEGTFTQEVERR